VPRCNWRALTRMSRGLQGLPHPSHTGARRRRECALANVLPDNWHWHMFDTVKAVTTSAIRNAIEYMCRAAPRVVYELEHFGVPFSRLDDARSTSAVSAARA